MSLNFVLCDLYGPVMGHGHGWRRRPPQTHIHVPFPGGVASMGGLPMLLPTIRFAEVRPDFKTFMGRLEALKIIGLDLAIQMPYKDHGHSQKDWLEQWLDMSGCRQLFPSLSPNARRYRITKLDHGESFYEHAKNSPGRLVVSSCVRALEDLAPYVNRRFLYRPDDASFRRWIHLKQRRRSTTIVLIKDWSELEPHLHD